MSRPAGKAKGAGTGPIMEKRIRAARWNDRGATAVEYGLMVALIAAVIITAVALIGNDLGVMFTNIANAL